MKDGDEDEGFWFCEAEGRLRKRKGRRGESAAGRLFGKGGGWFGWTTPLCHNMPSLYPVQPRLMEMIQFFFEETLLYSSSNIKRTPLPERPKFILSKLAS